MGILCLSLFCYALLFVHSSFAIILKRKSELVALHLLSYGCLVTVNVLWLFPTVLWEGAQWLSGRVFDLRPRGCGFEPHQRHCVVSLSKTH